MKSLQTVCLLFAVAGLAAAQQYTISSVAGVAGVSGIYPSVGDATAVLATTAHLYQPSHVAVDSKGNIYISDYFTSVIRMVTASTGNISILAGNGTNGSAGDNGPATQANIGVVHGLAVDSTGNVYFSDTSNYVIRKVDTSGNMTRIAGNGTRAYTGDGSAATSASLWYPAGLVIDGSGNLYVADYGNYTVRKITPGGTISTVAGTGSYGYSGDGGLGSKAALAYPVTLALDGAGNLYIGDVGNNNIRKVDTSGNISTVVSGVTTQGMAIDSAGNFYYVDGLSSSVRKVLPGGGVVTIAGNGATGYGGDGGPGSVAQLNLPSGLTIGTGNKLYIADTGNDLIRTLVPVAASVGVQDGASQLPGSSLRAGSIAPGEILTLFGSGLGPTTVTSGKAGASGLYPTSLGGTTVTFNGTPAPIIYASSGLVAVVAPYEITGSANAAISLTYQGSIFTATMPVVPSAPALFTLDSSGTGQAAALNVAANQSLSVNGPANPAKVGSFMTLYATGEGYTTAPVDGQPANALNLPGPLLPVTVKIGSQTVTPSYAGGSPTLIAGVMQVNFQIPTNILPGSVQVQVVVGGYPSQPGVTVSITQ